MISIIIPFYNEEKILLENLAYFQELSRLSELIFVDGGSVDKSREIAGSCARVLIAERGRARQMNYGASLARSEILLFLHADTILPREALAAIERKVNWEIFLGGCLTQRISSNHFIYRLIEWQGNLRARLTKEFYGDQGIFVKREEFARIGGFPEAPIMEDVIFSRRLRKRGKTIVLPDKLIVSARRWEKKGIARTAFLYSLISILFFLKLPLDKIKRLYDDLR